MNKNYFEMKNEKCKLTLKEELALGTQMRMGNEDAKNELFWSNTWYVREKATYYANKNGAYRHIEELYHEGLKEMWAKLPAYDPQKNTTVRTYMDLYLKGAILDFIEKFLGKNCHKNSDDKIEQDALETEQDAEENEKRANDFEYTHSDWGPGRRLDYSYNKEDRYYAEDWQQEELSEDCDYADTQFMKEECIKLLYTHVNAWQNVREREIFEYLYGLNNQEKMDGKDIAKMYGITPARVCQIGKKIENYLRGFKELRMAC